MKVLMLIISSANNPVYKYHKEIWMKYMNSSPKIDSYFMEYDLHRENMSIENNTIYIRGKESYHPGMRDKSIDCFDHFLKTSHYDFIVRTNLSSLWNYTALLNYLETLPRVGLYAGARGVYNNVIYASGAGFIVSPDIAKLIVDNRKLMESYNYVDDVDIGYGLAKLGVKLVVASRVDIGSLTALQKYVYNPIVYHYRIKADDLSKRTEEEPTIMSNLLEMFY